MNLSYWEIQSFFKDIDVFIVGSGIVGLNAAISLKEKAPALKVAILERGILPIGASTRNAGFACFGSVSELMDDLQTHSENEVFALVEQRWKGLINLRARLSDDAIGYQKLGGYELFKDDESFEACASKIEYFNRQVRLVIQKNNVYQIQSEKITDFNFAGIKHLICNTAEAQIDTGKMMTTLLEMAQALDIKIFNGIEIESILEDQNKVVLKTKNGWELNAKHAIIATNGFAKQLMPELAVNPARNQVLISHEIPNLKVKGTFHFDKGYYYFRNINNRILFGGGRNLSPEIEQTDQFGHTKLIQSTLKEYLAEVILPGQEVEVAQWWSGILGVGAQKKPILKAQGNRIVIAVRLGGMGIAIGSLVGDEAAALLLNGGTYF